MGARKRVRAILRGPDGSAFKKCEYCGLTVAIALADMHECLLLVNKRMKSNWNVLDQPRSAFRFFMDEYMKEMECEEGNAIEMDNRGCEIWKIMSDKEREPYVVKANELDSAYSLLLREEENKMRTRVDDEADSGEVGKCVDDWFSCSHDGSLCFLSETVGVTWPWPWGLGGDDLSTTSLS